MDAIRRASLGFGILVVVWIAVYWWWQPAGKSIAFDPEAAEARLVGTSIAQAMDRAADPGVPARREEPVERLSTPPSGQSMTGSGLVDGVIAPRFKSYTVRRGDTIESIAQRELGARDLATAISRSNPLLDPGRLREGQVIQIPLDPTNIQGREVRRTPLASVAVKGTEYVVKPGDTLAEISKGHYGTTAHWKLILEANRDRLKDERSIRPGQTIVIPPQPSSTEGPSGGR